MEKRSCVIFLVVFAFLGMPWNEGFCQNDQADFLKGIKAVKILIDNVSEDVESSCIKKEDIEEDIKSKLVGSGIVVAPMRSVDVENDYVPYLYTNLNVLVSHDSNRCVYSIGIEIQDEISLKRNGAEGIATTWSYGLVGTAPTFENSTIRNDLGYIVEKFIHAYHAVNPRQ